MSIVYQFSSRRKFISFSQSWILFHQFLSIQGVSQKSIYVIYYFCYSYLLYIGDSWGTSGWCSSLLAVGGQLATSLSFIFSVLNGNLGVATFVQGTFVQGDHGPRGQMSKGQFSKEILVRGDFCPRKLLPVISLLKVLFLFSIGYNNIDWL